MHAGGLGFRSLGQRDKCLIDAQFTKHSKRSVEEAYRRSIVKSAQQQFQSNVLDAVPVAAPPQPSDEERALHNLTHIPYRAWCKFCVMSRARGDQHSHAPDPAGEAQREHPTNLAKKEP